MGILSRGLDPVLLLPQLILGGGGLLLLLVSPRRGSGRYAPVAALGFLALAAWACLHLWGDPRELHAGYLATDRLALFAELLLIVVTAAACALSRSYLRPFPDPRAAHYGLLLFSALGMTVLASATGFPAIFLGFQIASTGLCLLIVLTPGSRRSLDAGLQFFVMSAVATLFLLLGMALVYGTSGTLEVPEVGNVLMQRQAGPSPALVGGLGLMLAGLAFGVGAVPFQFWMPDVYEGAPAAATAYVASALPVAALAALVRILHLGFDDELLVLRWVPLLGLLAGLTMTVAGFAALAQRNTKRFLACSVLAHSGYLLLAVATNTIQGVEGLALYLIAYLPAHLGLLAVIVLVGRALPEGEEGYRLEDLAGLARRRPALAFPLIVCLLSLAGVPPTGGFLAKWAIFRSARDAGMEGLAIVFAGNALIAAWAYLRLIPRLFRGPDPVSPTPAPSRSLVLLSTAAAGFLLFMGLFPGLSLDAVHEVAVRFWGTLRQI